MLAIEGIGSWASHLGDLPNALTDSVPKLPTGRNLTKLAAKGAAGYIASQTGGAVKGAQGATQATVAADKVASTPAPGNEVVNTPAVLKPGLSRNAKIGLGVGALALVGIGVMKAMH